MNPNKLFGPLQYVILTVPLFLLLFVSESLNAQVYINEVMASNSATLADEDGDFPDWIELYNAGATAADLANYGISDDAEDPFKWVIDTLTLEPGAYYLLFASDKDRPADSLNYPHLNFKLSSGGEGVYITAPDSSNADSLIFPELRTDESYGRTPGDLSNLLFYSDPTPGSANSTTGYSGQLPTPELTPEGGFFTRSVTVSLADTSMADYVYFTLDGTDPTTSSSLFGKDPRFFNFTTTLKVKAIKDGMLPSDVVAQTYFTSVSHSLPVISLVTDPDLFFDETTGIYVEGPDSNEPNFTKDIEIPVHIEYYDEEGNQGFSANAGAKIYGAYSRNFAMKSLSVFFRGQYGLSELEYPLFKEKDINTFQSFILRNAGNDFGGAHMRDAVMTTIVKNDIDIDVQAYQPAVVYINGDYWGIHNIREKINEHYVEANYGIDADDVNVIENGETPEASNGSAEDFINLMAYLETADLSQPEQYESVTSQIDLDNYIDYMVIEIFYANTDWPGTNVKLWKPRGDSSQWRWWLYDTDHGFNLYSGEGDYNLDMIEHTTQTQESLLKYSNPLWSTLLFRKLLENPSFKQQFVTRMADMMNTVFVPERMIAVIDSLQARIAPEMAKHESRWGIGSAWQTGQARYEYEADDMRFWANNREQYMVQHMQTHWGIGPRETLTVSVSDPSAGTVMVNRAEPGSYPWSGKYFTDYPVSVTAIPKPGFTFVGWSGASTSADSIIQIATGDSVAAIFEGEAAQTDQLVINEIMYNPVDENDMGDWVELHNTTQSPIDLSGWTIKDEDDEHAFLLPDGTTISALGYLIIAQDVAAFESAYSGINTVPGDMGFGLAGGSDQVRVFNTEMELVDQVTYDDEYPWDSNADGLGFTLELKNPALDNSEASSWVASSQNGGTPGAANSMLVAAEQDERTVLPTHIVLNQNYPNPFNPSTNISYQLPEHGRVRLTVFDALGREIATLVNGLQNAGNHSVTFDASGLSSGIYFYRLETGNFSTIKKMMLIK
tara:strand:- start:23709 stop:26729 length:3021 start_codon:yes stop_codon:yes gene_type:complete